MKSSIRFAVRVPSAGLDRQTSARLTGRALKRLCYTHYLVGDVVDPLAEQRALDALGNPGRFRIAFDRCDLALQPASLRKRDCKLFLKLANVGVELVDASEAQGAMMDADNNKQPEQRRNKE